MSDLENAKPSAAGSAQQPRTWDFMETLLVALIADGAYLLTAGFALSVLLAMYGGTRTLSPAEFNAVWLEGRWQGTAVILGTPAAMTVLWVATRMARRDFAEYLALNWPSGGEIVRALALMTIVLSLEMFVAQKVGPGGYQPGSVLVVKGAAGMLALLVGTCIAAPILEEFVVRGFMFRGWSQSFLGPTGAILLTSALWAMEHTQYDWYGRLNVFFGGLALGHLRSSSNSTWLTVIAHSAVNTFIFFISGPYV
ncbi:CPBP family intramembrane glutamic endopeptidase [Bradyrhizobium iriomotense]|uniref:Abortive infection protein n=1 Tax=Bradyrhizobium iriomotense TaxID=441950 RepID=A0ABQ6ARE1_9BRAD|nr:type II CAAX endopeptidase family protein [Bradyrhizobium iriomotense]GLR84802.1 abortive infection protein [Bradyrhizobium iriomotense]